MPPSISGRKQGSAASCENTALLAVSISQSALADSSTSILQPRHRASDRPTFWIRTILKIARSGSVRVAWQIGLGYDWNRPNLFSGFRPPGTRADGFVGVNLDVTFGGGSGSIQGIPGIVPFLTPDVAGSDTLRFRNDVNFDFTGRIGAYVSPTSAVYALGGLSVSSVNLKYSCVGFCAVMPATPAFSADTTMWTYGGVVGAGFETQVD